MKERTEAEKKWSKHHHRSKALNSAVDAMAHYGCSNEEIQLVGKLLIKSKIKVMEAFKDMDRERLAANKEKREAGKTL